jgi:putative ABC transport system permease protein
VFGPAEENRASPVRVVVLRNGLWKRRFGGDTNIVGKTVQIQGMAFQVVGVLTPAFEDIYPDIDLYVPVTVAKLAQRAGYVDDRDTRWLDVYARRRPGVSVEQAEEEMRAICKQLALIYPNTNKGYTVSVQPMRLLQFDFESMRLSLITLVIGSLFVLLVGCANVTNLLLLRAVERRKEVALRLSLGASQVRLVRHFVLEGALLCLGGAVLGIGAAFAAVKVLARYANSAYSLPAFIHFTVDVRALAAALVLAILISLLIGIVPARKSMKVDLQEELQSLGKGHTASAGTAALRSFLVVSAIFFSVVLLIGCGLMIKSLQALMESNPGFRTHNVLTANFELPTTSYPTDGPVYQLYKHMLRDAQSLPDVEGAGLWAPGILGYGQYYQFIVPEGRSTVAQEDKIRVYEHRTSPAMLKGMGFTLLRGRDLTEQDDTRSPRVAVVSRSTADTAWPSQDPIGKRFWLGAPHNVWVQVVGVVADVGQHGRILTDHDFKRDVYFPLYQMRSRTASILLRTRRDVEATRRGLADLMKTIDPGIPVFNIKTFQQLRGEEEASLRLNAMLLIFFAASALALAVIGIYSILVYTVRQQSFEIGIRMALGADQPNILRLFVRKGLLMLGLGVFAGLLCALGLARTIASILFKVSPYDPLVFLTGATLIILFALPAILRPAYKATRTNPSTLFRTN